MGEMTGKHMKMCTSKIKYEFLIKIFFPSLREWLYSCHDNTSFPYLSKPLRGAECWYLITVCIIIQLIMGIN